VLTSVTLRADSLQIVLPQTVVGDSVQVRFTTRVVENATVFALDLGDSQRPGLWQSVEVAEHRANIVMLPELIDSRNLIGDLQVSTPLLTPNGDGIHDQVEIRFVTFKVTGNAARISVYDLAGHRIADLTSLASDGLRQRFTWSGRDGAGRLVPPGVYLYRIDLGAEAGEDMALRTIAVAY
jgi:hypothetical protein